jgi:protein-disulfide isomerase
MLKNSKGLALGLAIAAIIGASAFFLLKNPAAPAPTEQAATVEAVQPSAGAESSSNLLSAPAALKIDVKTAMEDRVIGNPNAPVTIVEYASLTCSHCANFETNVLPQVKALLLDTGKAKLITRDFPLDKFALKAAMVTRCISPLQYFNMREVLFTKQDTWTKAEDPVAALAQYASLAGLDADGFKACVENTELETAIISAMQKAQTDYGISSTPTFILNDGAEKITGSQNASVFEAAVEKLTEGK